MLSQLAEDSALWQSLKRLRGGIKRCPGGADSTLREVTGLSGRCIPFPSNHGHPLYFTGSGGKGIRTPGLFIANEALYQLSYTPKLCRRSAP